MFLSKLDLIKSNFDTNLNYYIGLNQVHFKSNNIKQSKNIFKNNFYIYQNSFFDNNFKFCNIMLPVYNCFKFLKFIILNINNNELILLFKNSSKLISTFIFCLTRPILLIKY